MEGMLDIIDDGDEEEEWEGAFTGEPGRESRQTSPGGSPVASPTLEEEDEGGDDDVMLELEREEAAEAEAEAAVSESQAEAKTRMDSKSIDSEILLIEKKGEPPVTQDQDQDQDQEPPVTQDTKDDQGKNQDDADQLQPQCGTVYASITLSPEEAHLPVETATPVDAVVWRNLEATLGGLLHRPAESILVMWAEDIGDGNQDIYLEIKLLPLPMESKPRLLSGLKELTQLPLAGVNTSVKNVVIHPIKPGKVERWPQTNEVNNKPEKVATPSQASIPSVGDKASIPISETMRPDASDKASSEEDQALALLISESRMLRATHVKAYEASELVLVDQSSYASSIPLEASWTSSDPYP